MSTDPNANTNLPLWALSVALVLGVVHQAPGQEPPEVPVNEPTRVYVHAYDGTYLAAAIRRPEGEGPFPAILFVHGGLGGGGAKATGRVRDHFFKQGYVVMGIDYRRYHFGEEEILDAIAGYRHLADYPCHRYLTRPSAARP